MKNKYGLDEYDFPAVVDFTTGETQNVKVACGFNNTDDGNAQRFLAHWHDDVRYCAEIANWLIWDGIRWAPDTTGYVYELAKDVVRLIHAEAAFIEGDNKAETKALRKAVDKWAYQSESASRIKAMVELARTDRRIAIRKSQLDANTSLINCPNGTLDLASREFRAHRREDLLTKLTAVPYLPNQASTYFYQNLIAGLPLEQVVYLQRMLGSFLAYTTKNKELLVIYGAPYARKSSVTQPVYTALGDYAKPFKKEIIQKGHSSGNANAAESHLAQLEGVRIAWTEETAKGIELDLATIKGLTSSGERDIRDLYEKAHKVKFGMSFVIETNSPPIIDADDEWERQAALDRTRIVIFNRTIPEGNRDEDVLRISTEDPAELTAALSWVIQGYFDRKKYGLQTPESVKEMGEQYQKEINPLGTFIQEQIDFLDGKIDGKVQYQVETSVRDLLERLIDTDPEAADSVKRNERSFNTQFKKILPFFIPEGIECVCKHTKHGSKWTNLQLRDTWPSEGEGIEAAKGGDAKGDEVTQKSVFHCDLQKLYDITKENIKTAICVTKPELPTILVPLADTFEPLSSVKKPKEGENEENQNGDEAVTQNLEGEPSLEETGGPDLDVESLARASSCASTSTSEVTLTPCFSSDELDTIRRSMRAAVFDLERELKHENGQHYKNAYDVGLAVQSGVVSANEEMLKEKGAQAQALKVIAQVWQLVSKEHEIEAVVVNMTRGRV